MRFLSLGTGFLLLFLTACSFKTTYIQMIPIDLLETAEENQKLAEDLMYYDPRYYAHNMPTLKSIAGKGVRYGYHIATGSGRASFKVTYTTSMPQVAVNLSALQEEFETFVKILAEHHIEKMPLLESLRPEAMAWADTLFSEDASSFYTASSKMMKGVTNQVDFDRAMNQLRNQWPDRTAFSYLRGQYYLAFEEIPESVSLFFQADLPEGKFLVVRISMVEEGGKWVPLGFKIDQF